MEVIPQLTADHIFLTMDTGAEQQYKELTENTLWKSLPAVKSGHVYEVNFETWMKSGPIADGMKVDDIVKRWSNNVKPPAVGENGGRR